MGRPRKYDWDDKRDVCWKLWTEDRLSTPQIVKWFANHFQIPESDLPGPNQFHHKFRQWGFPPRRETLSQEDEEKVLARCTELFSQNLPAGDIQRILLAEGFNMDNYHFRAFRRKYGMMMRSSNGYKSPPPRLYKQKYKRKRDNGAQADVESAEAETVPVQAAPVDNSNVDEPPPLSHAEAAKRAQRLADLQIQSDEALRTRKRRRRIRGYGHFPADHPSMAPRYGSETSLDECKAYLHLTNEVYLQIRKDFQIICREMGIMKMSECADGQWQASKDRLVRESAHLSAVLHPLQPDLDHRQNALNCICNDVTKRMRHEAKALSIADANNILGLNPLESKNVRRVLYEILEADHFTTAVACGKEHLNELREQWVSRCEPLRQAVDSGDAQKVRAVDLLNRDTRKRYGDDMTRKDPSKKQWQKENHQGPGPGPAQGAPAAKKKRPTVTAKDIPPPPPPPQAPAQPPSTSTSSLPAGHPGVLVGPTWFGRAHQLPDFTTTPTPNNTQSTLAFDLDPLLSETTHGPPWPPQSRQTTSNSCIPAYFRLAPSSQVTGSHPRMWLGKLTPTATFEALQRAATAKLGGAAKLTKVSGVVKNEDGSEDSWVIGQNDELEVYLSEAGEKPTFVVVLEGGYV